MHGVLSSCGLARLVAGQVPNDKTRQLDRLRDSHMARLVFFGSVLAIIILILIWDHATIGARVAKAALFTYLGLAVVLLIIGLTVQWE